MSEKIITNQEISSQKLEFARKIILELQQELPSHIAQGSGPFLAAIYNNEGRLITKQANSVINESCSTINAEINKIDGVEMSSNKEGLLPSDSFKE